MKKIEELKQQYEHACNEYVRQFCSKQELEFDGWVGNDVGGVCMCGDYFFNIHDIVWDMNSNQQKGLILKWSDECVEFPMQSINYYSYTKGMRAKDIIW